MSDTEKALSELMKQLNRIIVDFDGLMIKTDSNPEIVRAYKYVYSAKLIIMDKLNEF
jgi:hypothetical protein